MARAFLSQLGMLGAACGFIGGVVDGCEPVVYWCDELMEDNSIIIGLRIRIGDREVYLRLLEALKRAGGVEG